MYKLLYIASIADSLKVNCNNASIVFLIITILCGLVWCCNTDQEPGDENYTFRIWGRRCMWLFMSLSFSLFLLSSFCPSSTGMYQILAVKIGIETSKNTQVNTVLDKTYKLINLKLDEQLKELQNARYH